MVKHLNRRVLSVTYDVHSKPYRSHTESKLVLSLITLFKIFILSLEIPE
uniref:Uncharacterized protein n=1 Tax=Manihot esculenta TaxID=3983 RepID=A0A2C9W4X4_MANES